MNTDDFYTYFNDIPSVNQRVDLLWEILVKKDPRLIRRLTYLIKHPLVVENKKRFAAVLRELDHEAFIQPLFDLITETLPNEPEWIYEYLLTLDGLTKGVGKRFQLGPEQTRILLGWIVSPERGSKSGVASKIVLQTARNDISKDIFIDTVQNSTLPFYIRLYCFQGLVEHYGVTYKPLFEEILARDPDAHFKRFLSENIGGLGGEAGDNES